MVMNTLSEKLFTCAGIAQDMNGKFVAGAQFSFFYYIAYRRRLANNVVERPGCGKTAEFTFFADTILPKRTLLG